MVPLGGVVKNATPSALHKVAQIRRFFGLSHDFAGKEKIDLRLQQAFARPDLRPDCDAGPQV